jgi:hypothetical protein
MAQRGRKSAASNVVSIAAIGIRPTIIPSRPLTKPERDIFNLVVREHRHLRTFDAPLLTGYAIACVKMLTIKDPTDFEKIARVAMSLATKLRLTPQSVMRADALGRRYADAEQSSGLRKPWDPLPDDEDEDAADDADAH